MNVEIKQIRTNKAQDTIDHLRKCPEVREEERVIERILNDDGSEREWMRKTTGRRKKINAANDLMNSCYVYYYIDQFKISFTIVEVTKL